MKATNPLLLALCFSLPMSILYAQTATTIFTPNGSTVPDTYIRQELNSTQIAAGNNYVTTTYPNATIISNSSRTYNCHAYAWHMSEGGSNVWIGYNTNTAEDIYWDDHSYIQICGPQHPAKVSYSSDDHSAVTTNTADIFISKWGSYPLMQHEKTYVPYNSSNLKYYIKTPPISGAATICNPETYSISGLPANASIAGWSVNPSSLISMSVSGNSVTLTSSGTGTITLTAAITNSCGPNFTIQKSIDVNPQAAIPIHLSASLDGDYDICEQYRYDFNVDEGDSFQWVVDPAATIISGQGTPHLRVSVPGYYGQFSVGVTVGGVASCSGSSYVSRMINIIDCSGFNSFSVYPNPANDELIVETTEQKDGQGKPQKNVEKINLLDEKGRLIKSVQNSGDVSKLKIDTSTIPSGTYSLHIYKGKKIVKRQIIIRH